MSGVCIGFGEHEGACGDAPDYQLNKSGLWCTRCEHLRRQSITESMAKITAGFDAAATSEERP